MHALRIFAGTNISTADWQTGKEHRSQATKLNAKSCSLKSEVYVQCRHFLGYWSTHVINVLLHVNIHEAMQDINPYGRADLMRVWVWNLVKREGILNPRRGFYTHATDARVPPPFLFCSTSLVRNVIVSDAAVVTPLLFDVPNPEVRNYGPIHRMSHTQLNPQDKNIQFAPLELKVPIENLPSRLIRLLLITWIGSWATSPEIEMEAVPHRSCSCHEGGAQGVMRCLRGSQNLVSSPGVILTREEWTMARTEIWIWQEGTLALGMNTPIHKWVSVTRILPSPMKSSTAFWGFPAPPCIFTPPRAEQKRADVRILYGSGNFPLKSTPNIYLLVDTQKFVLLDHSVVAQERL